MIASHYDYNAYDKIVRQNFTTTQLEHAKSLSLQ